MGIFSHSAPERADLYDRIHRVTWSRGTAATLAGSTMGVLYGGGIGLVAACLPYLLGILGIAGASVVALPTLAAIGSAVALCAGVGGFLGIATNKEVSANASSVAAGIRELERRHPELGPPQHRFDPEPEPTLFRGRVGLITGLLFGAFGALISLNPVSASAVALLGFQAGTQAAAIASAVVFGLFGAVRGIRNSVVSDKINDVYFSMLTGKPHAAAVVTPATAPGSLPEIAAAATPAYFAQKVGHAPRIAEILARTDVSPGAPSVQR